MTSSMHTEIRKPIYELITRLIDIVLSGSALLVLSPLLIPLMILLKLTGEGYVFYLQERIGYRGKPFNLIKFATMLKASPSMRTGTITLQCDPRVLPVGNLLRKTKINELPQIINVFLGDMTLVGPRPQTQECYEYFPEEDREKIYWSRAGVTGIGSIVFRDEEEIIGRSGKPYDQCYREDIMPYKLALELWYHRHRSLWVDGIILLLTVFVILSPSLELYSKLLRGLPDRSRYVPEE